MKKLIYLFSALALFACEQADVIEQPNQGSTTSGDLPEVIYATVADNHDESDKTRTVVAKDGKTILWNTGDAISYIGPDALRAMYQYEGYDRVATAAFTYKETSSNVPEGAIMPAIPYAVYPYSSDAYCKSANTLVVDFPAEQTYALGSFGRGANVMVAVGEHSTDDDFYFRNACGYLVIKLKGEGVTVKSITLTALGGEKIAGNGLITANHGAAPTVEMSDAASSTITLNCGEGVALSADATEFWFAIPPTTFEEGFKIHVTPAKGLAFEMQTSNQVKITRNEIQPMAALQYTPNTQTPNQIVYTKTDEAMAAEGGKNPLIFGDEQSNPFDATIKEHYYDESIGKFVIEFSTPVKTIGEDAFFHTVLQTIELPEGLETIKNGAFAWSKLEELTIPGSVNTIESEVFDVCFELESITFLPSPDKTPLAIAYSPALAQYGPFYYCPLASINLNREFSYVDPDGDPFTPDEDDEGIFYDYFEKRFEASITIGDQVRTLSPFMFSRKGITSITIPGTVTTIGNDVFNECTALSSITFEPSPTNEALTIGWNTTGTDEGLFVDCPLQTVNLNRQLTYAMASEDLDEELTPFSGKSLGDGVTLGEQVHTLLPYMFYNSGITSLKIPGTVTEIMDNAFYDCTTLASVRFEGSSEPLTIGFQPGTNERGPFYQSPLTSIYVNRELVASSAYAAARDSDDEGIFSTSFDGDDDPIVSVTLQGNVKTISEYMFSGLNIQTIWIPREVTKICKGAFYNCSKLYGMTLAHTGPPTLIEDDDSNGGAFKGTLLNDPNVQMRWIALEDGSDENVKAFKDAINWRYYAYIIKAQSK